MDIEKVRAYFLNAMAEKGVSRRQLSERAGLGESAVRDVLSRTENPGVITLARICDALGISLVDVLTNALPTHTASLGEN